VFKVVWCRAIVEELKLPIQPNKTNNLSPYLSSQIDKEKEYTELETK